MTVRYTSEGRRALTEAELEMLRKAEAMPPNYDEDCPELTPEMEEAFREARRRNPFSGNREPESERQGLRDIVAIRQAGTDRAGKGRL